MRRRKTEGKGTTRKGGGRGRVSPVFLLPSSVPGLGRDRCGRISRPRKNLVVREHHRKERPASTLQTYFLLATDREQSHESGIFRRCNRLHMYAKPICRPGKDSRAGHSLLKQTRRRGAAPSKEPSALEREERVFRDVRHERSAPKQGAQAGWPRFAQRAGGELGGLPRGSAAHRPAASRRRLAPPAGSLLRAHDLRRAESAGDQAYASALSFRTSSTSAGTTWKRSPTIP